MRLEVKTVLTLVSKKKITSKDGKNSFMIIELGDEGKWEKLSFLGDADIAGLDAIPLKTVVEATLSLSSDEVDGKTVFKAFVTGLTPVQK